MPRAVGVKHGRSGSPASSNPTPSGIPQGSPGGRMGMRPGRRRLMVGDEVYLWLVLGLEVAAMGFLRNHFRRYHGG
jgi:hypothetical protein